MLSFETRGDWVPSFRLEHVDLNSCKLGSEFPPWLQSQKGLRSLNIANTRISDTIPTWFSSISSQLEFLNLSHNQIHGDASSILRLEFVLVIDLGSNNLNGPLPRISSNIVVLDLSNNSFAGSIYHFLCGNRENEIRLQDLFLDNNVLSGEIPDCWMNYKFLEAVRLENNNLTGTIPNSFGNLTSLKFLHLGKNNLSGRLPASLQNCRELMVFDLGKNGFRGSIPTWAGKHLSNLMVLNFRSNKFRGVIPRELCHLASLQILDLAHNHLLGTIPSCFNNFSAMAEKSKSNNRIYYSPLNGLNLERESLVMKGREVEYSTTLHLVTSLDLSNNDIVGEIPEELTSLLGLRSLNLSGNYLRGMIPRYIGAMGLLESLDFSVNQLSGEIPPSISNLTFLNHLNLSYNNLTGKIPLGPQLQTFEESSYLGNLLCGPPLTKSCDKDGVNRTTNVEHEGKDSGGFEENWFYLSMAFGFIVGFGAVIGPLLFNQSWRILYFKFLDSIGHKLYDLVCK
ncbi:unnamed protein product [Ilex paraguariensis]|uniref:Uncharacterized protein n=1 Tax=Ilex paraguariensis TaxID=185542 RepID=A0ABC8QUP5_9AQUA